MADLLAEPLGFGGDVENKIFSFWRIADHFLPAIAFGLALGRLKFRQWRTCGTHNRRSRGMDFGDGKTDTRHSSMP